MVMMLRQCCCGCSLYTGTITSGSQDMLGGLAFLIIGISTAAKSDSVDEDNQKELVAVGAAVAVFGAILLVVSICLMIGALKDKPALLVPWMVYNIVFLVANTIICFVKFLQYFPIGDTDNGSVYIIGNGMYLLLETYYLLVVYSLYRELKGTAPPNSA